MSPDPLCVLAIALVAFSSAAAEPRDLTELSLEELSKPSHGAAEAAVIDAMKGHRFEFNPHTP
jgi:hypothetical protein